MESLLKQKDHRKSIDEGSKTTYIWMHLDRLKSKCCCRVPQLEDPLQNIVFPGDNGPVAGIDKHALKATQVEEHSGKTGLGYYKNEISREECV